MKTRTEELRQLRKELEHVEFKINNGRKQLLVCQNHEFEKLNSAICQLEVKRHNLQYKIQNLGDNKPTLGLGNESNTKLNVLPQTFKSHKL